MESFATVGGASPAACQEENEPDDNTCANSLRSQRGKRRRTDNGNRKVQPRHCHLQTESGAIPTFSEMLRLAPSSPSSATWRNNQWQREPVGRSQPPLPTIPIPPMKVGSLEIYARFPRHYDELMRCHDCSALLSLLESQLSYLQTLRRTYKAGVGENDRSCEGTTNCIKLMDLGCGTGRIARLLLERQEARLTVDDSNSNKSSDGNDDTTTNTTANTVEDATTPFFIDTVIGYDKYPAMLRTMCDALPRPFVTVEEATSDAVKQGNTAIAACGEASTSPSKTVVVPPLRVCLRPISFEQFINAQSDVDKKQHRHTHRSASESEGCDTGRANSTSDSVFLPCQDDSQQQQETDAGDDDNLRTDPLHNHVPVDIVVAAWSLSYIVRAHWGGSAWHPYVDSLVQRCLEKCIDPSHGGVIVVIETLGTGRSTPTRRLALTEYLESRWNFVRITRNDSSTNPLHKDVSSLEQGNITTDRDIIPTNYHFPSRTIAEQLCRFFFAKGDDVITKLIEYPHQDAVTLEECTGMWALHVPPKTQ